MNHLNLNKNKKEEITSNSTRIIGNLDHWFVTNIKFSSNITVLKKPKYNQSYYIDANLGFRKYGKPTLTSYIFQHFAFYIINKIFLYRILHGLQGRQDINKKQSLKIKDFKSPFAAK